MPQRFKWQERICVLKNMHAQPLPETDIPTAVL